MNRRLTLGLWVILGMVLLSMGALAAGGGTSSGQHPPIPLPLSAYEDDAITGIWDKLVHRVQVSPFNLVASLIFLGAIIHTFAAGWFQSLAHRFEHEHEERLKAQGVNVHEVVSFRATACHFLGEVEAIFGIWLVPLFIAMAWHYGWHDALLYSDKVSFVEPIFVVVIMAIASTRPIIQVAESLTETLARWGGGSVAAWWLVIMTALPLVGSLITEPAAMTIAALVLGRKFFALEPSAKLKYATLGNLFVAISVGGTLTHFAAPPIIMVASTWQLTTPMVFMGLGWKSAIAMIINAAVIFLLFRKEFAALELKARALAGDEKAEDRVPAWVSGVHFLFLAWTVMTLHHPALVIGGLLFFIAFTIATAHHQEELSLRSPIMVGFFLGALVMHGGLQGWWLAPILGALGEFPLFIGATILTAFNDNAAITFLASQVPQLNPAYTTDLEATRALQYAVVAGAVAGGGLTVIANAPNPAGQSLLARYFGGSISPLGLALGALGPTLVVCVLFKAIRGF